MSVTIKEWIESDESTRRWKAGLLSKSTKDQYSGWLKRFCEHYKVSPKDTLQWSNVEANNKCEDFWNLFTQENEDGDPEYGPNTARQCRATLVSWFERHSIKENPADNAPTYKIDKKCKVKETKKHLDYIPDAQDAKKLIEDAPVVYRTAMSFMYFSGMRPVDVLRLKYKHIRRSYEAGEEILSITLPQKKTGLWYSTFLGPIGLRYLSHLLQRRIEAGEEITDESYVVSENGEKMPKHILKRALARAIKKSLTRHPTNESFKRMRPYNLRKSFRREAIVLGEDTAEYLLGHKKGLDSMTAVYAGLRDQDHRALEILKAQYVEKVLPRLEWDELGAVGDTKIQKLEAEMARLRGGLAHMLDLEDNEVPEAMTYIDQAIENFRDARQQQAEIAVQESAPPEATANPVRQKVVNADELEQYLEQGWRVVLALNNGSNQVVVDR